MILEALAIAGLAGATALLMRQVRGWRFKRIERLAWAKWTRLGVAEKSRVLRAVGVVTLAPGGAASEAALDRLFSDVLVGSWGDLRKGVSLDFALLDEELAWAFERAAQPAARASGVL